MSRKAHRKRGKRALETFHRRTAPGASPGTLSVDPDAPPSIVRVIAYGPDDVVEADVRDLSTIPSYLAKWPVTWVNVDGLGDLKTVKEIGRIFNLHPLALEDVVNVHQRPKVEPYQDQHFIVAREVTFAGKLGTEQTSLFLGKNFLLTFQEAPGDCLDPVRHRIRQAHGRHRNSGPDYLAYSVLDAIIDSYFPVLEEYGEALETLEDDIVARPGTATISKIHGVKRDLLAIRRAVWPFREAINSLFRDPSPLVREETRLYLRDCYDHTIQIIDLLETYREIASGLVDVYLSSISNRMNEVMKVLTIIATIFMPLSFLAGLYGMNFNTQISPWNMPELEQPYGYPLLLLLMASIVLLMLFFFRRKGFIGKAGRTADPETRESSSNGGAARLTPPAP
jgi:magnesium transporter